MGSRAESFPGHQPAPQLTLMLGKLKKRIEVSLSQLVSITLVEYKQTALMQGSVYCGQVIHTLWEQGNVTGNDLLLNMSRCDT